MTFQTKELERERAARLRRQEKKAQKKKTQTNHEKNEGNSEQNIANAASNGVEQSPAAPNRNARKPKQLNLRTYKYHALGDYVSTIQHFGTTDSYSTQTVFIHLLSSRTVAHPESISERT
jgi:hypothetical protein